MAQRIIGMGDMEGLLEKVQSATSEADIERMTESLKKNRFTLEDMLMQLQQIKRLGPLEKVHRDAADSGRGEALKNAEIDPKRMKQTEAIILSMTPKERRKPGDNQGQPPPQDSGGLRNLGADGESGARAVRADEIHDEDLRQDGRRQKRRLPHAAGHGREARLLPLGFD